MREYIMKIRIFKDLFIKGDIWNYKREGERI